VTDGVVEAGDGFGGENERGLGRELGGLGGNGRREGTQQRVLVKLGEKAVVVRVLGILMQPIVELRGGRECDGTQPQGKREPSDGESAGATGPLVCKPVVHCGFT